MKKLEPTVGLTTAVAIGVSSMLGPAIFVLPGLAYAKTGSSIWLAYLVAGISVLPAAISKAELATAMPASGGTYVYISRAFGPLAGTIAGLGLWMSLLLKSAFALIGFAAYLYVVAPNVDIKLAALCLLVGITVLNIMGVSKVGKAQLGVVSISVAGLVALMFMSTDSMNAQHFENPFPEGGSGFIAAAAFVFFAYSGVTKVAAMAEEIKNPERNLPLAMFIALFIAAVLYGLVTFILVAVVPGSELSGNAYPIYLLADAVSGELAGKAIIGLAILTMTAMAAAGLLASSRFPFAMSRDHLLPDSFSHIDQRFKTPIIGIVATALVMGGAILFLDIGPIAKLASAFKIIIFMVINLAIIVLRESRVEWYRPTYRSPLYPWVQIFGLVTEGILLLTMGIGPAIAVFAIAGVGTLLFFLYGTRRTNQRGVMSKLGSRRELLEEAYNHNTQELRRTAASQTPNVLVAMNAGVRSPEILVEVGVALSGDTPVRALHITEVPEQILDLDAVEEEVTVTSLRRRVAAMSIDRDHEIEFDAVASHDSIATIHRAASESGPEWAVLEWAGRRNRDLFIRNPRQWLHRHMPCNLALFHDAGVRYIREIIVYPEPGPDDALVVQTADHLAETYGASLTFARFIDDAAEATDVQQQVDYLDQIRQISESRSNTVLVRGKGFVDAMSNMTAGYDLLVMGAPAERGLKAMLGTKKDQLTEHAGCSVLWLSTPQEKIHGPIAVSGSSNKFDLLKHIEDGCLRAKQSIQNKNQAFTYFASSFAESNRSSHEEIHDALWTRERTQNTSVGYGVALPHATIPGLETTTLGIFTLEDPLSYQAIDGQPVDVFIVTLGPPEDRQTHLLLLATVSKLILHTKLLDELRAATDADALQRALERNLARLPDED